MLITFNLFQDSPIKTNWLMSTHYCLIVDFLPTSVPDQMESDVNAIGKYISNKSFSEKYIWLYFFEIIFYVCQFTFAITAVK